MNYSVLFCLQLLPLISLLLIAVFVSLALFLVVKESFQLWQLKKGLASFFKTSSFQKRLLYLLRSLQITKQKLTAEQGSHFTTFIQRSLPLDDQMSWKLSMKFLLKTSTFSKIDQKIQYVLLTSFFFFEEKTFVQQCNLF